MEVVLAQGKSAAVVSRVLYMFTKLNPLARSKKTKGILWIVAGTLCLLPRLFSNGNGLSIGIGIMFIVFGIVSLSRIRN